MVHIHCRCLIEYPEVQRKIHDEIEEKLGAKEVSLNDKGKLVYLEATINEVMRLYSILPLGVPRRALADMKVHYQGQGLHGKKSLQNKRP